MTSTDADTRRPRRSHAERREATRAALVTAAIASLVEEGWAGTTTRSVAQRAGVSQGAMQHHFPTKRDLVEAALSAILEELATSAATWEPPAGEDERVLFLLDRLWEIHCLPVNHAVQELLTVARTDPETATLMKALHGKAEDAAVAAARQLLPEAADHPGFDPWVRTGVAAMRGLVAVAAVVSPSDSPLWQQSRAILARGLPR